VKCETKATGETCKRCGRTKKPFEKAGALCIHCKQLERMGERPDDAPQLVLAPAPPPPPPPPPEPQTPTPPPPAVTQTPTPSPAPKLKAGKAPELPKCWRCGRISGVRTKGAYEGLCVNCENNGRGACKRLGRPNTVESIKAWCREVPYGSDHHKARLKPVDEVPSTVFVGPPLVPPAPGVSRPPRYICGPRLFKDSLASWCYAWDKLDPLPWKAYCEPDAGERAARATRGEP
jgi:hypothetical protein